jgi:hypothetical protein
LIWPPNTPRLLRNFLFQFRAIPEEDAALQAINALGFDLVVAESIYP